MCRSVEYYLLHAKMLQFQNKVAKAKEVIKKATEKGGEWIISFSGGKDSSVMLDLIYSCGYKFPLQFFYYSPYETPEATVEIAKKFSVKYDMPLNIVKVYSCAEAWEEAGRFFCIPQNEKEKLLVRKTSTDFRKKSAAIIKNKNACGVFVGMRKDESKIRRMAISMHGKLYFAKDRHAWCCTPIADFSADDIWAYIFKYNLPYLSVYDNPMYDRERIRNELTYMCCGKGMYNGILESYWVLYPEIMRELQARWGDVRP